jgi:hypothetical protein
VSIITNIDVYWSVAEEAHNTMQANLAESRTPNPNGDSGYIIRRDPDRRSFKNAMVTITFAGMYLDALLYILIQDRLGRVEALKVDRLPHEDRLERLGLTDLVLLNRVKAFREARKDLVHEKAIELADIGGQPMHTAQNSADSAMSLMQDIRGRLLPPNNSFKPRPLRGSA